MKGLWIRRAVRFLLVTVVMLFVLGFATMYLWNWLMPALFGWKVIRFWQAVGLLALARILFGRLGRGRCGGRGSHLRERWRCMTPEQREKVRAAFRSCAPPPTQPEA